MGDERTYENTIALRVVESQDGMTADWVRLPYDLLGKISARIINEVGRIDGILEMERVRIRRAGNRYFADLSVGLARNLTFQKSEQLAVRVTEAVRQVLPEADVVVHSLPLPSSRENMFDRIRAVAARNNLNVHDLSIQHLGGRLHLEQHLESCSHRSP